MPFGMKPRCTTCKTTNSAMWRKSPQGEVLCNSCGLKVLNDSVKEGTPPESLNGRINGSNGNNGSTSSQSLLSTRKSARQKITKPKSSSKALATKGKNRRIIFKKNPIRAAPAVATVVTSDYIFHEGSYLQVGDIVSVLDEDDGVYYAQVRGLLEDQYCQKSAVITWLLPTTASPKDRFDPATYILGPEEDLPRKLEYFQFVCHAPSDYYKAKDAPYNTVPRGPELGYIWTTVGPEVTVVPSRDEIFFGTGNKKTDKNTPKSPTKSPAKASKKVDKEKNKQEKITVDLTLS